MKRLLCSISGLLVASSSVWGAVVNFNTIGQWTFENGQNSALPSNWTSSAGFNGTAYGGIAADIGTGVASGLHTSTSTVFCAPAGNGSARAFSANNWGQGDYWQFSLNLDQANNTYANIGIVFDQFGSGTGPANFQAQYSTDGTSFTPFGSYTIPSTSWSSGSVNQTTRFTFDLSAITDVNTANAISFRLVDISTTSISGGTVGTGGTDRIDNFTVTALVTPVPEPGTAALVGFGLFALLAAHRRR